MKGISSKDGKMSGNVQLVERYDQSKTKKPARPKETGGESGGEHEASGHDEIKQVVGEHGAAHKVEISHDHEAQHSTVTSHHEDGHKHTAHFDGEDHHAMAHAHAAHAGGVSDSELLHEAHMDPQSREHEEEEREEEVHPGIHRSIGAGAGGFMPESAED